MSDFKPGDINKLELDYTQNSVYKFDLPCSPVNLTCFPVVYKNGVGTPGSVCGRNNCPRRKNMFQEAITVAVKEKIRIRLKGYDHQLVDQSAERIVATAKRTNAQVSGPVPLPTEKQIITILRAVHKYKDSREQFEMRTHKRLIDILRPYKFSYHRY